MFSFLHSFVPLSRWFSTIILCIFSFFKFDSVFLSLDGRFIETRIFGEIRC
jgi:hypothetical protein